LEAHGAGEIDGTAGNAETTGTNGDGGESIGRLRIGGLGMSICASSTAEDFKLVVASTDKIYAAFFSW